MARLSVAGHAMAFAGGDGRCYGLINAVAGNVGAPEVYGAHHGGFIPIDNGFSSTFGSFLISGPGLKQGYERPREELGYIHAVDVVPTICHILGVDPPAQTQAYLINH